MRKKECALLCACVAMRARIRRYSVYLLYWYKRLTGTKGGPQSALRRMRVMRVRPPMPFLVYLLSWYKRLTRTKEGPQSALGACV
jgi:hypothetical protein